MRNLTVVTLAAVLAAGVGWAQGPPSDADPPPPQDPPGFWRSTLEHVDEEVQAVRSGTVETIAVSPGGHPVYAVRYGEKEDLHSQANYNSAVAARSPAWYAGKDETTKPVILFLGPVHGQEVEGVVGLVNLIRVAETGADHRARPWPDLKRRHPRDPRSDPRRPADPVRRDAALRAREPAAVESAGRGALIRAAYRGRWRPRRCGGSSPCCR